MVAPVADTGSVILVQPDVQGAQSVKVEGPVVPSVLVRRALPPSFGILFTYLRQISKLINYHASNTPTRFTAFCPSAKLYGVLESTPA